MRTTLQFYQISSIAKIITYFSKHYENNVHEFCVK